MMYLSSFKESNPNARCSGFWVDIFEKGAGEVVVLAKIDSISLFDQMRLSWYLFSGTTIENHALEIIFTYSFDLCFNAGAIASGG